MKFDHEEVLSRCDSYTRLPTILDLAFEMRFNEWLKLLGEEWACCDNISNHIDSLAEHLSFCEYPIRSMMDANELVKYDELPDVVTIYRGCYSFNKRGLSWSLDREVAEEFPFLHRYKQPGHQPLLVKARVNKSDIIAVKLSRNEAEIITFNAKIISTAHARKNNHE